MELRHLRYFCAVADWKGFSQAARRLHVSQSSVSEQVRDLEQEIGVPLLNRIGRNVALTPHGAIFLREAREILTATDRAVDMARRSLHGEIGTLSIGFMVSPTAPFFPQIIRDYRSRYPGVRLSLFEMGPARQIEALLQNEIDIGFTREDGSFGEPLRSECLYNDVLIAVLPEAHPLAGGPIALEALAEERFVLYDRESSPSLHDTILSACRKAGFSPRITNTALMHTVLTLVAAGEGVALVPSSVRYYRPDGVAFCRLEPEAPRVSLIMAWRADSDSPVQNAFLDLVRENKPHILRVMTEGL